MKYANVVARLSDSTPLGFEVFHPGGMDENSPAFHRWVWVPVGTSPIGTTASDCFGRPFGTRELLRQIPSVETLGYFHPPLRGEDGKTNVFGLETWVFSKAAMLHP